LEPVYVHRQSRTLSEILAGLLLGSNNYIANQVFLEIGAHRMGGPVNLEKSLQVANETLAKHGLASLCVTRPAPRGSGSHSLGTRPSRRVSLASLT
jgi:D-Ala-D-Ala carboxypeptidase 3 (S13) family